MLNQTSKRPIRPEKRDMEVLLLYCKGYQAENIRPMHLAHVYLWR